MAVKMTVAALADAPEQDLGASGWHLVEQRDVDLFAEATGDDTWLHVDQERAREGPFGTTVAHGYFSLSRLPVLLWEVLEVTDMRGRVNYGIDRLRFTAPVPCGSRVRVKARLLRSTQRPDGVLYTLGVELEVAEQPKPALVGEVVFLVF